MLYICGIYTTKIYFTLSGDTWNPDNMAGYVSINDGEFQKITDTEVLMTIFSELNMCVAPMPYSMYYDDFSFDGTKYSLSQVEFESEFGPITFTDVELYFEDGKLVRYDFINEGRNFNVTYQYDDLPSLELPPID